MYLDQSRVSKSFGDTHSLDIHIHQACLLAATLQSGTGPKRQEYLADTPAIQFYCMV